MNIKKLSSSHLHLTTTFIFIFIFTFSSASAIIDEGFLKHCPRPFRCGNFFQEINYPFWGGNRSRECGLPEFELRCQQNDFVAIDIANRTYRVVSINQSHPSFTIARDDLCPEVHQSTELWNIPTFRDGQDVIRINISYFFPSPGRDFPEKNAFTCDNNDDNNRTTIFFGDQLGVSPYPACESNITIPVLESSLVEFRNRSSSMTLQQLLNRGFRLDYGTNSCSSCGNPGRECWSMINPELSGLCFCRDEYTCFHVNRGGGGLNVGRKVGIAFGAAAFGAIVMGFSFFWYQRRQRKRDSPSVLISRNISSYSSSWTDHEKSGSNFGVHIFSYDELEEATKDFDSSKILGDGGFGTVYKGELQDGRVVAVKRLYEKNCRIVEQFITEVEILTRMRHSNLVSLYGCTSRHSRELLLVYEYIPNGTVADHLHGVLARPGGLPWSTRMSIALETASALAYLHASDIIHRDVKTNNILLDKNFSVKVADFGLSRLFPNHLTHISTAPQGTPGYVDPEYHDCYQLTDKSDVFSFGVVLIELISSKPAVDITRHRHEINLSNMAINRIQNHALHELVDPYLGYATDSKVTTMICLVAELAFQCLQHGRDMRPSMHEVVKTLEEIQKKEQNSSQMEVIDIPAADVVLLSNGALHSPDSVMGAFVSMSTTSNSSN